MLRWMRATRKGEGEFASIEKCSAVRSEGNVGENGVANRVKEASPTITKSTSFISMAASRTDIAHGWQQGKDP